MVIAVYKGYVKGLIVGIFSFIAYFIGLAAALKLSVYVADYIGRQKEPSIWLPLLSFIIVFLVVVVIVNLAGRALRTLVKATTLGWADRLGGIVFFIIIYIFIFSILIFYASEIKWISESEKESSKVYPYIAPVAPAMVGFLGRIFPFFKDLFHNLELFFENLGKHI